MRELTKIVAEQILDGENLRARVDRRDQLLTLVVEGLTDAVIVIDSSERIRFANKKAMNVFQWQSDPIGRFINRVIINPSLTTLLEKSIDFESAVEGRIRLNTADGERIVDVDIAPLAVTGKHSDSRTRIVLRDITEKYEIEQVRKDFVANASHELRTPLTIINGYLETLMDGGLDDRQMTERFLGVMRKHGDRLARIIEDMLTISKLESSPRDVLQLDTFDLSDCVNDVFERLSPVAESKGAKLVLTVHAGEPAEAVGDRFYWDQILFNLAENALKENDKPDLIVNVTIDKRETSWQVTVEDNGTGISTEDLPFIFKRFFRGDKQHSPEKKGTGLGLSIVKRAVEAHQGTIRAESILGTRTAFIMNLPYLNLPQKS